MTTIHSYTTIEQSKALAKILPLESADMYYCKEGGLPHWKPVYETDYFTLRNTDVPCWSFAALLSVLPRYELNNFGDAIQLDVKREALETEDDETLLDLVVNMIIHLHELKKL